MSKYKRMEIELTPQLMKKLFEFVKDPKITATDFDWLVNNLAWMSKDVDPLTIEEFEHITKKPTVI
jgi:hypothetical protein